MSLKTSGACRAHGGSARTGGWVIAAVDDSIVRVLDPGLAAKRSEVRLGERAEIANLLAWIDETR
ncbi:MAG: hypothetical protein KF729_18145 [Sandaracinaceae bacterium]|nr:hypothetical protein [Sandaracinaceae bacterium]